MARRKAPELTFQQHIADFLVRKHKYGVLEQTAITDTEFYINLDRIEQSDLGYFIEAKSRTWSHRDAEHKAELARGLLTSLGVSSADAVAEDYVEIAGGE